MPQIRGLVKSPVVDPLLSLLAWKSDPRGKVSADYVGERIGGDEGILRWALARRLTQARPGRSRDVGEREIAGDTLTKVERFLGFFR
jgi:hypothetical protein